MIEFLLLLLLAILILCVLWRICSRHHTLPCPVWMRWLLDPPSLWGTSARTRRTISLLDLKPGMQVLDAGCGPGRLSIPLATAVGPEGLVTSLDLQEGMLQIVRERATREHITNISYVLGGIGEIDLGEDRFDRTVLITVLGEIPNQNAALRDLFKAIKPGGFMVVEETIRDPHFQRRGYVTEIAGRYGFREIGFYGNRLSYTLLLEKPISE